MLVFTVEVRWLQALSNRPEIVEVAPFSNETNAALDAIVATSLKKMQIALKRLNVRLTMTLKQLSIS